jgi:hypothetical protein
MIIKLLFRNSCCCYLSRFSLYLSLSLSLIISSVSLSLTLCSVSLSLSLSLSLSSVSLSLSLSLSLSSVSLSLSLSLSSVSLSLSLSLYLPICLGIFLAAEGAPHFLLGNNYYINYRRLLPVGFVIDGAAFFVVRFSVDVLPVADGGRVVERREVSHHVTVVVDRQRTLEHHGVLVEDFLLVASHHYQDRHQEE